MPPHLARNCGRIFFASAVISAASATPVWSFHNHAIAAGCLANFLLNTSGCPLASTRSERLLDGDFRPSDVIRRMRPREIRVAPQNGALRAVRVSPDGRRDFRAVGD